MIVNFLYNCCIVELMVTVRYTGLIHLSVTRWQCCVCSTGNCDGRLPEWLGALGSRHMGLGGLVACWQGIFISQFCSLCSGLVYLSMHQLSVCSRIGRLWCWLRASVQSGPVRSPVITSGHLYSVVHKSSTTTAALWPFVQPGLPGEPVPEASFTHSHLSWLSIVTYQLPTSTTINSILPV